MSEIERIPYKAWSNSQLSVARHYGGININGKSYVLDYDNCEKKIQDGEIKYFPDLVLFSSIPKKTSKKEKPINLLSLFPINDE